MLYVSTHQPASSVSSSTLLRLSDGSSLVVVNKGALLEIIDQSGSILSEQKVNGRIRALASVSSSDGRQKLLMVTDKMQYTLAELTDTFSLMTVASGSFASTTASFSPSEFKLFTAIDSTLVLHSFQGLVQLLYVDKGDKVEVSTVRIKELNLKDLVFLDSSSSSTSKERKRLPLLAVLHYDANYSTFISTYQVDAPNGALSPLTGSDSGWNKKIEVYDSTFKLTAVPGGGLLAFSESQISYFINGKFKFELETDSVFTGISSLIPTGPDTYSNQIFVSDAASDLHVLDVSVSDGKLTRLGETSSPSSITSLSPNLAFIGSHFGDSQFLHIEYNEMETYPNLAPIVDFSYLDPSTGSLGSGGQSKVVACCGFGKTGSLRILSNGVGVQEIAELEDVAGVQGVWPGAMSVDSIVDELLLVSFFTETKILCVNMDGEIAEWEDESGEAGLILDESTLAFGTVVYDQLIQVTPTKIVLLGGGDKKKRYEWTAPAGERIVLSSINSNQIIAVVGGNHLMYFEVENGVIISKGQVTTEHEVSCLDISCFDNETVAKYFVAGLWNDGTVRIFSVKTMQECRKEVVTTGDQLPRSVRFCTLGSTSYLLVGLGDGHLVSYVFDSLSGITGNRKKMTLGTQPLNLISFRSDGKNHVFSASDLPSVLYSGSNDKLMCSNLNLKSVSTACQFRLPSSPNSLVIATASSLKFGSLDNIQKLHIQTVPLENETPRRIVHLGNVFGVLTTAQTDVGGEGSNYLKVVDDQTYAVVHSFKLPLLERACGLSTLTVEGINGTDSKRHLFVVGTGIFEEGSEDAEDVEPTSGRVIALEINPETQELDIVCSIETKGCVYAVAELKGGAVVSTIGSKVEVFQFNSTENVLVSVAKAYGFNQAIYLSIFDDFIAVADIMKSVTLLEFKRPSVSEAMDHDSGDANSAENSGTGVLTEVARDYLPSWTSGVHAISQDLVVVGELENNLYTLRRQKEVQLEEEKKRLELAGVYHLGDLVSQIRKGSLATNTGSENVNPMRDASMLYSTTNGQFGSIIPLDADKFKVLNGVQANLAKHMTPFGNFDHTEWRTFVTDRRRVESMGYIDGDFVQQFTQLPEEEMLSVFNGDKNGGVKVEAEGLEDVLALLEEVGLLA
ncbi:CPSF A subunit region-domain-containing protein [Obelidium mucronatum]|nr:CPSF A subunit region-domain-containing protein [Obelidium mucronatum]